MEKETKIITPKSLPNAELMKRMLAEETKRQQVLDTFIKKHLRDGVDYGASFPGSTKPSLLKAGAEKVIGLFNLRAQFKKDEETLSMINIPGTVAFKCELVNRASNEIVGEGRGVAHPKEKTSWNANTQVKICEKRAMVDAVLQTFGLSSRYTQDGEDLAKNNDEPFPDKPLSPKANTSIMRCVSCDNTIDQKVVNYSKTHFGKPLCRDCQKDHPQIYG